MKPVMKTLLIVLQVCLTGYACLSGLAGFEIRVFAALAFMLAVIALGILFERTKK